MDVTVYYVVQWSIPKMPERWQDFTGLPAFVDKDECITRAGPIIRERTHVNWRVVERTNRVVFISNTHQ